MKEEIATICLKNHIPLIKMKIKMDSNCRYTHFYLIEILSNMTTPLAQQHIKNFFVFTYNTNYILGKEENIDRTQKRLEKIIISLFKRFLFKQ